MGQRFVVEAIRQHAYLAHAVDDFFPENCPDQIWLERAGREGWIVLTRDKHIRSRVAEWQMLRAASVLAFVVTTRQVNRNILCEIVTRNLDRMNQIAQTVERPAVYSLGMIGAPKRLFLRDGSG